MSPDASPDGEPAVVVDTGCLRVVESLLGGDPAAVAEVYRRFVDPLVRRADRLIPAQYRGKIQPESVVHSVMQGLLEPDAGQRGRLAGYRIDTWEQLYGLLARMTFCKCLNRVRSLRAARRAADAAGPLGPAEVAALAPSPEDEAAYAELLARLLDRFQHPELEVLHLRLAGHTAERIAAELNLTTTTVRSTVRRLQRRLEKLLAEQGPA